MEKEVYEVYERYGLPATDDRQIDVDDLDSEWLEHTNIFGEYSDAASLATFRKDQQRTVADRKKNELERVKSELTLAVKADPSEYNLEKATEASVEACVKTQDEYLSALDDYISAWEKYNEFKFDSDILQGAVKTMEQRRFSLENSMRLMSLQYFETPSEPKTDPASRHRIKQKSREQSRKSISEAMDHEGEETDETKTKKRKSTKSTKRSKK